jgi:release factor glutamine methyltransferase
VEDARLNMEHLLAHVLGCRRLDLYLRFDTQLDEAQLQPLRGLTKRRGEGEPLQHLLGTVPFHGHDFVCDQRALVPRPETEHLVSLLVEKQFREKASGSGENTGGPPALPFSEDTGGPPALPCKVLDMGCGSGCIGLSLAKAWPQAEVTLADVSEDSLELTRLNAERLGFSGHRLRIVRSDLFEKLEGSRFDLVVANLPYIPSKDVAALSREVRRDPHLALDGGATGLDIIFRLLADAPAHLNQDGWIVLELHHDQAPRVSERLQSLGFVDIQAHSDLGRIERFVFARHPSPQASRASAESQEPSTES